MKICVFCGSSSGNDPAYIAAARELGTLMAKAGHELIYGGANIGLMGAVADAVLAEGGYVTGVIPGFLVEHEIAHRGISELIVVNSMHERKRRMAELTDAFLALPGGWGTLEELAEMLTWNQLRVMRKPIGLLNTLNFFDPLLASMQTMVREGFLKSENLAELRVWSAPADVLRDIDLS